MSREQEIEEITEFISKNKRVETSEWIANGLSEMGYRRADDVAREIWSNIKSLCRPVQGYDYSLGNLLPIFAKVFDKYGIEVNKVNNETESNKEMRDVAEVEAANETAKQLFDEINGLYKETESMKGTDVSFKCGALDALNNVLDIFCRKFGLEVDD